MGITLIAGGTSHRHIRRRGNVVEVGAHVEAVNEVLRVAHPGNEGGVGGLGDGRVNVHLHRLPVYLQVGGRVAADALVELPTAFRPLAVVHHDAADLLLVLPRLVPY